jgi:hypothetical protein
VRGGAPPGSASLPSWPDGSEAIRGGWEPSHAAMTSPAKELRSDIPALPEVPVGLPRLLRKSQRQRLWFHYWWTLLALLWYGTYRLPNSTGTPQEIPSLP